MCDIPRSAHGQDTGEDTDAGEGVQELPSQHAPPRTKLSPFQQVSPVWLQFAAVVVVEVVVVVTVVQADVTELHVQEPQRVLKTPQFTLHRSVQERPEHWVAQLD